MTTRYARAFERHRDRKKQQHHQQDNINYQAQQTDVDRFLTSPQISNTFSTDSTSSTGLQYSSSLSYSDAGAPTDLPVDELLERDEEDDMPDLTNREQQCGSPCPRPPSARSIGSIIESVSSRTAEVSQQLYKNLGLCGVVPSEKNIHKNEEVSLPEETASYPLHRQSYSSPVQYFAGEEEDHHVMRRSTSTPATLRQSSFGGGTKSAFHKTAAFSPAEVSLFQKEMEKKISLSFRAQQTIKEKRRAQKRNKSNHSNNSNNKLNHKQPTEDADTTTESSVDNPNNISKLSSDESFEEGTAIMENTSTVDETKRIVSPEVERDRCLSVDTQEQIVRLHEEEEDSEGDTNEPGYQKLDFDEEKPPTPNTPSDHQIRITPTSFYQHFEDEPPSQPSSNNTRNGRSTDTSSPAHHKSPQQQLRFVFASKDSMSPSSHGSRTAQSSNQNSSLSSYCARSITSSVAEADREVMETNRRERRRRFEQTGDITDGLMSVHSSDTASTNTQAYLAMASTSKPREGASMPIDRFFANAPHTRIPRSSNQTRSPVSTSLNSLATTEEEEPPRFVSYPDISTATLPCRSNVSISQEEDSVKYSKLGSSSGEGKQIHKNRFTTKKNKKSDVLKYHNMNSMNYKPPMSNSKSSVDAYDNFYRKPTKRLQDGMRTPTPPLPSGDYKESTLSPPSQILESAEAQELQRRGAASRPNVVRSKAGKNEEKLLLLTPDAVKTDKSDIIINQTAAISLSNVVTPEKP